MPRTIINLNGTWQLQLDPAGTLAAQSLQPDRTIPVPMPWQAAFADLQRYSGYAWYQRTVELDAALLAGAIFLDFGAVDYWCQVFVNGMRVGEHEGGYTPFSIDATAALHTGENTLAVRVYDSAQEALTVPRWPSAADERTGPPFDARDVPHGKQEWYLNVGGIWQDVTLRAVPKLSIARVHVTPDITAATATVAVTLAGDVAQASGDLTLTVDATTHATIALVPGQTSYRAVLNIAQPRLWTLDDPFLYSLVVQLGVGDAADVLTTRFGMRSFGARDGHLLLNDQPIYLLSALDQDFYPDTIYTVPSDEFLRDQFQKAKALGLNNLRCHIKPPDPRYLDLADEIGLLVWAEIPSWRTFWTKSTLDPAGHDLTKVIRQRVEQMLAEMIARDYNHPSLVIWTMVNEDWGTTLPLNADDRAWIKHLYEYCKQLDPTRLVVDNSPCFAPWGANIHVKSDIDDFHVYTAIPDHAHLWTATIDQFALRPLWTYSAHGDSERRGDEPLVLSEFGNWGLPSLAALRAHYGGEPDWFDLTAWWSGWGGEAGQIRGVEQRFAALGLAGIWPDYEALAQATQWHQFEAMKYEIEAMRRHATIAGYVVTEFTDCYWEANGLLDFARNPKAYHTRFANINAPDVIVPEIEQRAVWAGETVIIGLALSHYSGRLHAGGMLTWQLEDQTGTMPVEPVTPAAVVALDRIAVRLPSVATTTPLRIRFTLHDQQQAELARNEVTLTVFPAEPQQPRTVPLAVHCDEPLRQVLQTAGYQAERALDRGQIVVAHTATADLLDYVRSGGDLLLLSQGPSPFYQVAGRSGAYSGDWMTSFNWLRPDVHPTLPTENPLGMAYLGATPKHVILGLPLTDEATRHDVLAGMFSGWIGHPAAYTVQFRYGAGRVIMTTFPLRELYGIHPIATAMLDDLIAYLASDRCQPTLRGM